MIKFIIQNQILNLNIPWSFHKSRNKFKYYNNMKAFVFYTFIFCTILWNKFEEPYILVDSPGWAECLADSSKKVCIQRFK